MTSRRKYYIGIMTGTSMDGIDAALVSFRAQTIKIHRYLETPYPEALRTAFFELCTPGDNEIHRLQIANHQRTALIAECVKTLCSDIDHRDIVAIADHGQTIRHFPNQLPSYTLQAHHGALLAELTGICCVVDFRSKDMAAGGQGAPLAPAFHHAFFADPKKYRFIANIGGMANLSLIKPGTSQAEIGFDTGPGNALLDGWIQHHTGARYDKDGKWATSGTVNEPLLALFLEDTYFKQHPPKSTGREYFNMDWLQHNISRAKADNIPAQNIQATLVALVAHSIALGAAQACSLFKLELKTNIEGIYICGGGAYNPALMDTLRSRFAIEVHSTERLGVQPNQIEAAAFAWLGKQAIDTKTTQLSQSTGARHENILGAIYPT